MPIGIEKFLQIVYLAADVSTLVGVGDAHAVGGHLHNLGGAQDICSAEDGVSGRGERLMLHQFKTTAVIHQGVTGNAGLLVIGF